MSDYISRQAALDALGVTKNATKYGGDHSGYDTRMLYEIHDALTGISAADVAPVVYGEWIHDGHHRRCNRCGTYFCNTDREGDIIPNNFCPNCGAKMDREE